MAAVPGGGLTGPIRGLGPSQAHMAPNMPVPGMPPRPRGPPPGMMRPGFPPR